MSKKLKFDFGISLVSPSNFCVKYNADEKLFFGAVEGFDRTKSFITVSADFKMRVFFSRETGVFCGFEYYCNPDAVITESINVPCVSDGSLYIDSKHLDYYPGAENVIYNQPTAVYDKSSKCFLVKDSDDGETYYRICENLVVSLDLNGEMTAFYILGSNSVPFFR